MRREIAALPGVIEVGRRLHHAAPQLARSSFELKAEGKPLAVGEAMPRAEFRTADPDYFRAAGIPLLEGREFAATDRDGLGQGRDHQPDARRPALPRRGPDRQAHRVDRRRAAIHARQRRLAHRRRRGRQHPGRRARRGAAAVVFMPFAQELAIGGGLVIRADSNAAALAAAATRIVRRIAPAAPIENVLTVAQIKDQSVVAAAAERRAGLVVRHPGGASSRRWGSPACWRSR